jgi:hypothetical protein
MSKTLHATAACVLALAPAATLAAAARAASSDAPPVGTLPPGPTTQIQTQKGELVAIALPARAKGRVWRIARAFDARVLREVTEANVGDSVVIVFKARAVGEATIRFGLTRGETAKAYESRRFDVRVRPQ